ncbi:MAG: ComEC family competence protein [Cytophagia bacterium]|nr:MAG: ComEC family competence protein [Runella sp.]TAG17774.1 MAG: ComEC family competence protein [Cytophagales bacterium]TAG37361.1 MAG: ComEC family competence protein [Cytophagia bacterium]TAG78361.1 MAG: ComEC family competence protein [Cytophagales bacterium]
MNTLLRFTLALVAGIVLSDFYAFSPRPVLISCAALFVFLLAFSSKLNRSLLGSLWLLLAVGLGWTNRYLTTQTNDPAHLSNITTDVQAYEAAVVAPVEIRRKTYKTEVSLLRIKTNNQWQAASGRVLVYVAKTATEPSYGAVLLIRGAPKLVPAPQNPDQFDYRKFLTYRQIFHQHYLRNTDFVITNQTQTVWYKAAAYHLSKWSDAQLKRLVPWPREYAVTKAMVLGLRDEMDPELVQAYSVAGAVHVLSVSGFHIAIFVYILGKILGFLEKRKHWRWVYLGATLGIMWFYAVLTGLSAPVIRSALMFTLLLLAQPLGRKKNTENALFGSALVLLILDPMLIYSVSFQLSYAALAGIIFWQPFLYQTISFQQKWADWVWGITAVALTAQLATFPLGVYYFNQFPVYFWLLNPVVVGLAFVQLPLALATIAFSQVPFLADILGWATTFTTWLLNQAVVSIEALPHARLAGLAFSTLELVLVYALIGTLLLLIYHRNRRWLWVMAMLSLVLCRIQLLENEQYDNQKTMVAHAVPYQTAVSLVAGQHALLIADTAFLNNNRAFDFYLDDFYTQRGIRQTTRVALENVPNNPPLLRRFSFGQLLVWQNKKVVFIEQPVAALPPIADLVLVRKSAYRHANDLLKSFGNQVIVLDNSNKYYILENLQKEGLPYYFTNTQGAWVR